MSGAVAPIRRVAVLSAPIRAAGGDRFASIDGERRADHVMAERAFEEFVAKTRAHVDGWLAPWLRARLEEACARGAAVEAVASACVDLLLRGGKRQRAALLAAAYEASGGEGGGGAVVAAGAALELLQGYLLTHDDWMDGDDVRRGGPSVPAVMRIRFESHADAMSVLAGDLVSAWSQRALLEVDLPAARVLGAARELSRAHEDVVEGQVRDVAGNACDREEVQRTHSLKTASYTVRAPVAMGARLAGADDALVEALVAFAEPLGVAFQLRDDVLGIFGDPKATGKPAGGDLRAGKRTAVIVQALDDPRAASALRDVLGHDDVPETKIGTAMRAIENSGARAAVEATIDSLVAAARDALAGAGLALQGRTLLEGAVVALTARDR